MCSPARERVAEPVSASPIVAEVDGDPIWVDDVDEALRGSRRKGVEVVIQRRLAAGEARRRGLPDINPVLRRELEKIHRQAVIQEERLLRDALFSAVRAEMALPEDQVREHYEKTKERYLARQWHFRVATRESEEEAKKLDAALGEKGRLDPASSEEVGPAPVERLPKDLLPAVRLELVDLPPAVPRTFEESREWVEESLRILLAQQAFDGLMERLRGEAHVRIDESVLADDAAWTPQRPVGSAEKRERP